MPASFDDEDSFIDDSSITVDIEHSIGSGKFTSLSHLWVSSLSY